MWQSWWLLKFIPANAHNYPFFTGNRELFETWNLKIWASLQSNKWSLHWNLLRYGNKLCFYFFTLTFYPFIHIELFSRDNGCSKTRHSFKTPWGLLKSHLSAPVETFSVVLFILFRWSGTASRPRCDGCWRETVTSSWGKFIVVILLCLDEMESANRQHCGGFRITNMVSWSKFLYTVPI